MFKIKKKIHSETKPDWVVCVLYKIPPRVYDCKSLMLPV